MGISATRLHVDLTLLKNFRRDRLAYSNISIYHRYISFNCVFLSPHLTFPVTAHKNKDHTAVLNSLTMVSAFAY